mgnify:CR=1 FL=1
MLCCGLVVLCCRNAPQVDDASRTFSLKHFGPLSVRLQCCDRSLLKLVFVLRSDGVTDPYGWQHGLRAGDIVVSLNGTSILGQDFTVFTKVC